MPQAIEQAGLVGVAVAHRQPALEDPAQTALLGVRCTTDTGGLSEYREVAGAGVFTCYRK